MTGQECKPPMIACDFCKRLVELGNIKRRLARNPYQMGPSLFICERCKEEGQ